MKKVSLFLVSVFLLMFSSQALAANVVGDVTNGSEIRGIVTDSAASGYAKVSWDETTFTMHAQFEGLSDPLNDDFYEGWLVRKSPFAFISTGKLTKKDGKYHNHFSSATDYSDYSSYVLTLEPNDGDDAPADHILEGMTTMVDASMMMNKKDHMMEKKDTMMEKKEMMKEKTMTMKEKRKKALKAKIDTRLKGFSPKKRAILLERVKTVRASLDSRNLSETKKALYVEVLDAFAEVLETGEMMDK